MTTGNGCGDTYGDIYAPREFGSGGGSASTSTGVGGGRLHFVVHTMIVDGSVEANGQAGNSNIGGGSGGSIYIQSEKVEGFGYVDVSITAVGLYHDGTVLQ